MKLWAVTIERTIMVVADDETQAEQLANENEREESMNDPDFVSVRQVLSPARIPEAWQGSLPYGGDGRTNCLDLLLQQLSAEAEQKP
jgi:hypothetical protein